MGWRAERVGRRGLVVLGVAGLVGVVLAVHGYGQGALPGAGTTGLVGPSRSPASSATPAGHRTRPASGASGGAARSGGQKLGPTLASTPYAAYAFEIYPATPSAQARLAMTGFRVQVTAHGATITVRVSEAGSPGAQTSTYAAGDRVYFVETSLGDDSGDADYNLGDDGLVVTDATGRIVE